MKTRKHILLFFIAALIAINVQSQNKINRYEYWFDSGFATKVATNLTPASNIDLNTNIPTSGLSIGLHTFHLRFRDDSSSYSGVVSSFFLKLQSNTGGSNGMVAYEYWFDNNYGSKSTGSLGGTQTITLNSSVLTSSLAHGLHTFHIRFKDNLGMWSAATSQFFLKQSAGSISPTPQMSAYEYWFDDNYSAHISTAMAGNASEQILTNLGTSGLTNGLHTIHIRFKDISGKWSSALSQFFIKQNVSTSPTPQLVQYEHWFDNDYANKVTNTMGGNQSETIIAGLSTTNLPAGLHVLHIRIKDGAGQWSGSLSQFFLKQNVSTSPTPQLVQYEHWFDNDYTNKVTNTMGGNQSETIIAGLSTTNLPAGLHVLHIRIKDGAGQWSSSLSQFFFKQGNQSSIANNLVTAYRYWFDTSFVSMVNVQLAAPVNPLDLVTSVDMTHIRKGSHTIHFQFRDTLKQWSVAVTDTVDKQLLLIPDFSASNTSFCDNGTVTFQNNSIDGDKYLWDFGDGYTDTVFSPAHTYTTTGSFSVTLTITDTASGSDSSLVVANQVIVTPTPSNAVAIISNDSICQGKSMTLNAVATGAAYLWSTGATTQNITVSSAGNYSMTVNVNGCISQSNTYSITVIPNPLTPTVTANGPTTFCAGSNVILSSSSQNSYLWNNGATTQNINVNTTGNYSVTVSNSFGCSASSTLTSVTINPAPSAPTITASGSTTFCPGGSVTLSSSTGNSYIWNNGSTTQNIAVNIPGNYSVTITNGFGCTASSTITGVVVPASSTPTITASGSTTFCTGGSITLSSSAANAYQWNNGSNAQSITVNAAGNYSVMTSNGFGCTSTSGSINITVHALPVVTAGIATDTFCVYSPSESLIGTPLGGTWTGTGAAGSSFDPNTAGAGLWDLIYTYSDANSCNNSDTVQVYVDLCTGVNELPGSMNILVYPNPTFGEVIISTGGVIADEITISDALGKTILILKPTENVNKINLSKFQAGIYFLNIRSGTTTLHRRIVRE